MCLHLSISSLISLVSLFAFVLAYEFCMSYYTCVLRYSIMSDSFWLDGLQPARLLCPWNFPGKNTGAGCHFPLQGIFPTQGSNLSLLHLLHGQVDSLPLSHLGSLLYLYLTIFLSDYKWYCITLVFISSVRNTIGFVILSYVTLLNSLTNSRSLNVDFLGYSMYSIMSFADRDIFIFFYQICMPFFPFLFLFALLLSPFFAYCRGSTISSKSSESWYFPLFLMLGGKLSVFDH